MMQTFAYYPGCVLQGTAKEYDVSVKLVCGSLGIQLQQLKDWVCCGASSTHLTNHLLSIVLPAVVLKAAQEIGLVLATACAMCYFRFKITTQQLAENKHILNMTREIVGEDFQNSVQVIHLLQLFDKEGISVKKPLSGLNVACYYGCLLVRPQSVGFDDPENPQVMDRLIKRLGAKSVDWAFKTECCGMNLSFARGDIVLKLSHRILLQAKQNGADCIAVACPMCHVNLDMYQKQINKKFKDNLYLPVFYFTQLIGLAMGFSPKRLLMDKHFTNPMPLLKSKDLIDTWTNTPGEKKWQE